MKTTLPYQLFILCTFVAAMLSSFQLGAHYTGGPYRAWYANASNISARNGVEFTQIGVQQSQTLLIASSIACGFSFLGLGLLLFQHFRRKDPVHLPGSARGNAA